MKKKNKVKVKVKSSPTAKRKPLKKQNYLKYLGIIGFILLFLLVYYRKTVIQILFHGEVTMRNFSLISTAHAQDDGPSLKKKLLESSVKLEKVSFKPLIGLDGFRVVSTFNIEEMSCAELDSDINQLAVILYPPEVINEKFLIKMRDCVLKLNENHSLNKWMKWIGKGHLLNKKEEETKVFLADIINSKFNLITDVEIRNKIINIIHEIPEETLSQTILKSYLYLMVGNITRSDNLLRKFILTAPRYNWEKSAASTRIFHDLGKEQAGQIFTKLAKHPADRRSFELFCLYLQAFYNDEGLLKLASDTDTSDVEAKLSLKYIKDISPHFVHYIRLTEMNESQRFKNLRNLTKSPLSMQSYWVWTFMEIDPLVSDVMYPELKRVEKEDELWFIYLMHNEKLSDLFSKKAGKSFLPGRRPFLKSRLDHRKNFMMSLFKLIELGDINQELITKTTEHLINE
jgi:hypothetical protein